MKTYIYQLYTSDSAPVSKLVEYQRGCETVVTASFEDKVTGKAYERPQYKALKAILESGDTLIIEKLNHLGESYQEMRGEWKDLADRDVSLTILDNPILSTAAKSNKDKTLIVDSVYSILSTVIEKEKEKLAQKIKEGMVKARFIGTRSGKAIGRPERKDTIPPGFEDYYKKWMAKQLTAVEFAKLIGMSRMSLYRYVKTYEGLKEDSI